MREDARDAQAKIDAEKWEKDHPGEIAPPPPPSCIGHEFEPQCNDNVYGTVV